MSTLTQCPACGTLFRVVPDQLRVSNGWVRCGNCGEAFEARKYFAAALAASDAAIALDPPDASQTSETSSSAVPIAATRTEKSVEKAAPAAVQDAASDDGQIGTATDEQQAVTQKAQPEPQTQTEMASEAERDIQNTTSDVLKREHELETSASVTSEVAPTLTQAPADPAAMPEFSAAPHADSIGFLREAKRRAFWRKGWVRAGLSALALLLAASLMLQLVYHERDRIAAARPDWIPHLQQMCAHLNCKLRPLRAIDAVAIESHAFNQFKGDVYRLRIALKNNSSLTVALPAVELTLTNAQEEVVGRRVLMPLDMGVMDALPQIGPGQEFSANLMIQLGSELAAAQGSRRVAGYSVYTFYP